MELVKKLSRHINKDNGIFIEPIMGILLRDII